MIISRGPYLPQNSTDITAVVGDSGGTINFNNPGNAATDNGIRSTAIIVPPTSTLSRYLWFMNFGSGWNIPNSATVTGVMVEIEKGQSGADTGQVQDNIVQLIVGGVNTGTNKADTVTNWTVGSDVFATYGGSTDLWGLTLTPSQINTTFGFAIAAKATGVGNATARVDFARMTVWFTYDEGNVSYVVEQTSIGTKVTYAWKAGTDGTANLKMLESMDGQSLNMMTIPITCTDNYDITLLDDTGVDALQSNGLNKDTVTAELKVIYPASNERNCCFLQGIHTFRVENATSLDNGVCIIYYRPVMHKPQIFAMLPNPGDVPNNLFDFGTNYGNLRDVEPN